MRKFIPVLMLLIGFGGISNLYAQSFGLKFDISRPGKSLGQELDHNPAGVSMFFLLPLMKEASAGKLSIGGELGVAMYADETYQYEYAPGEFEEVYEEDCFFRYHLIVQYELLQDKLLIPFVEARTGFTSFFSDRHATDENSDFESDTKFHGTAFNTGLGGGLYMDVARLFNSEMTNVFLLSSSVQVLSGTQTVYRDMANIEQASSLNEGLYQSKTGMVTFSFGMRINFGRFSCSAIK